MQPLAVYVNWTAYDELADTIELTESLAMRQLDELLRLRSHGVQLDAYIMDAFWYDVDSGYRAWRKPHWPDGPDRWLNACHEHNVIPGLWFSTNSLCHMNAVPTWEDSMNRQRTAMCMFDGGFMTDFLDVLQHWYDRGIRVFKFDFVKFDAASVNAEHEHLPHEIIALNHAALRSGLGAFRRRNPDACLMAFNGFGGIQSNTSEPFRKTVDVRLLDAFDSLYCGDPCPIDVPMWSLWRSQDVYSDHMVRHYLLNGIPLDRIDSAAFVVGATATAYWRKTVAWKGMLLLVLARGGRISTYYGSLGLIDDEKAAWFAKAQGMFLDIQARGQFQAFGGMAGEAQPYGYAGVMQDGAVYVVVNPSQSETSVVLPAADGRHLPRDGRVLFHDAGYEPQLSQAGVKLGPEQMCLIGYGSYADEAYDLGVQEDVVVPAAIGSLEAVFEVTGHNEVSATITPPSEQDLRITMVQRNAAGIAHRSCGGCPPDGRPMSDILRIAARQGGSDVPVEVRHDIMIWSGMSWAVGEIRQTHLKPGDPLRIVCSSTETQALQLSAQVHGVRYA